MSYHIPKPAFEWKQRLIEDLKEAGLSTFTYAHAGEDGKVGINMNPRKAYNYPPIIRAHTEKNYKPRNGEKMNVNMNIDSQSHVDTADVLIRFLTQKGFIGATKGIFTIENENSQLYENEFVSVTVISEKICDLCVAINTFNRDYNDENPDAIAPIHASPAAAATPTAPATSDGAAGAANPTWVRASPDGSLAAVVQSTTPAQKPAGALASPPSVKKAITSRREKIEALHKQLQDEENALKKEQDSAKQEFLKASRSYADPSLGLSISEQIALLQHQLLEQQS
jgi:hypothetical protein